MELNTSNNVQEDCKIIEEYKTWKKNCPYLYDIVISRAMDWPSLTLQWFPDLEQCNDNGYSKRRLLLGTNTSDEEQNYLMIADVYIPKQPDTEEEAENIKADSLPNELGGYGGGQGKIQIIQKIPHQGEVNRARYMTQKPDVIATRVNSGDVYIFDRTKLESNLDVSTDARLDCTPEIKLKYHKKEGYGLSWNSLSEGHLISSSDDSSICLWDIKGYKKDQDTMKPIQIFQKHTKQVGDVAYNPFNDSVFASVGDDCKLMIWDTRTGNDPKFEVNAHDEPIFCLSFSPFISYLLATGAEDNNVNIWDMRKIDKKLHSLMSHQQHITQLKWSPHIPSVIASSAADHRIFVWDLAAIGEDQSNDDAQDGPPELLFSHGGHTNIIPDFDWDPNTPWLMGSSSEDNVVQVWQMAPSIYLDDEDKISSVKTRLE